MRGRKRARVVLGAIGAGVSPYPFMLIYPQDQHERFLIERLRDVGVPIDRPTEVVGFEERDDRVAVRLKHADGSEETCTAAFLAGCDGARSIVREILKTGFPGGTYHHMFYVADAEGSGPVMNGELNLALDGADFLAVFPMKGRGRARFIGTVEEDPEARARFAAVERRQPRRPGTIARRREARELVFHLPCSSSRRRPFPRRARVSRR